MDNSENPVEKRETSSRSTHRSVQRSTTLNRKYVKKPTKAATIDSIAKRRAEDLKRRQALAEKINRERIAALKSAASAKKSAPGSVAASSKIKIFSPAEPAKDPVVKKSLSARELKDSAVESALKSVATMEAENKNIIASPISTKKSFGASKILLALGCAALSVGVIGYVVSLNMPDVSVRVAAMQAGFEATYPSYVPRGYSLKDIVSEDKKLVMTFSSAENASFTLSEEKSAWDAETLEENYAKLTWGANYTSVREQGITILISGSDAAWVNGGILYKIEASGNNLTKKQLKAIVTSL
ncbi:DUF4367 domain-containing protein [Candidatus Saccharibacteria bacterium]|nr:DUF4367 domain-containing protein [Candidatus Saccharibacteria bacterium]